jgi:hypothetical protein
VLSRPCILLRRENAGHIINTVKTRKKLEMTLSFKSITNMSLCRLEGTKVPVQLGILGS